MLGGVTVWHGPEEALMLLRDACAHNCTCTDDQRTCAAHRMLTDQVTLDHLAFVNANLSTFKRGEFDA